MAVLKIRKKQLRIARSPANRALLRKWIDSPEGRGVVTRYLAHTPARWCFGGLRARAHLRRDVRAVLTPETALPRFIESCLEELPLVIRRLGIASCKRGHKHLYSANDTRALVVVPRGVVQRAFRRYLHEKAGQATEFLPFPGLAQRVLAPVADEAESLLFTRVEKGHRPGDGTGKGMVMGVDQDYRWRLGGVDGHYYYACTRRGDENLDDRRTLKRFESEMEEVLMGQAVYLKRLSSYERAEVVEACGFTR